MRARISIDEVETRTKIRSKYLRAIENEEWDLLPGPVYAKSFIRTYGDFLGLDSRMLVDEFRRRYERPSDYDLRPISPLSRERKRSARGPLLPSWLVILFVLVAVGAALYVVGSQTKTPAPTGTRPTATQQGPPVRDHQRALAQTPKTVKLQLVPTGQVYVCLVDGAGKKLIDERIFTAGQTVPTETAPKFLLTLGNAAVKMKVNGRDVPIAPSGAAIRLLIGPTSTRPIRLSATPTCP